MTDALDRYTDGDSRTKWDRLADRLERNKKALLVLFAGLGVAYHFGYLQVPNLGLAEWFIVFAGFAGLSFGSSAVMWELSDYLDDKRVRVSLQTFSGYHDVLKIPKKTFSEFDIVSEGGVVEKNTLAKSRVLCVRAIDLENKVMIPAGEFPDDDAYPDDYDLHAEDTDMRQVQKYRNELLQDARERHNITVDKEVIRESAEGDIINRFADALEELRNNNVEISELEDEEELRQTAEFALQAAQDSSQNGGDGDE